MDSVLSQFFQKEMPEELRNLSVSAEAPERIALTKNRRKQTGLFSIFAVTAGILLIVSVVWKRFQNPEMPDPLHSKPDTSQSISDLGETPSRSNVAPSEHLTRSHSSNYLFSSSPNSLFSLYIANKSYPLRSS